MSGADEAKSIFHSSLRSTTTGLLVLITLIAFEAMAIAAALPAAAREVHGLAEYGWAFTGFLIANIVGMVAAGRLTDRRGPARALLLGLVAFTAGLVLAGTATTMVQLVAGRVVSGLGGGLLITGCYVVIGVAFPHRLQPSVFAAVSSAWVVPSLVGPVLSGLLAQHASWRWVFLGLVPFCIIGGLLIGPVLREPGQPAEPEPDGTRPRGGGSLVRAIALALGIGALEQAGQHPSLLMGLLALAGLLAAAWGVRRLVPAGTFVARSGLPAVIGLRGLLSGAIFGIESVVPLSLQVQHGYGATIAGLPLTASGISWAAGSWWQGRAVAHEGVRRRVLLLRAGFSLIAVAAVGMTVTVLPGSPGWLAYPSWAVGGMGAGLAMSTLGVLLLRYTTDATRGADSAALQLSDATSSSITTGIGGVLVAAAARGSIGETTAFVSIDLLMCAVAILGACTSARARGPQPASAVPATPVAGRA